MSESPSLLHPSLTKKPYPPPALMRRPSPSLSVSSTVPNPKDQSNYNGITSSNNNTNTNTNSNTNANSNSNRPSKAKSCRECIRLKLKCSRSPWPCDKCIQRGTSDLCPGDELPTRPYKKARKSRTKSSSSSTVTFQDASRSNPPPTSPPQLNPASPKTNLQSAPEHRMRSSSDTTRLSANSPNENEQGTLALGRSGMSSYIGPGGHSFSLAQPAQQDDIYSRATSPVAGVNEQDTQHLSHAASIWIGQHQSPSSLAAEPNLLTSMLQRPSAFIPIPGVRSPFSDRLIVDELSKHLPHVNDARRAVHVYMWNVSWMYDPVTRLKELWDEFYLEPLHPSSQNPNRIESRRSSSMGGPRHPHRLTLLFSILSLGSLFDVRPGARGSRAEHYYHCAWTALQLSNFSDANTLESVQAVHLIGQYLCNRKNGRNAESFYPLIGTAVRTAVAMGLHRDAQAWNLPPIELEERRRLFWELYACDAFRSLAYGRPCSLQDHHADATFPMNRCERPDTQDFHLHKFRVVRILNQILDTCHCRPDVSYSTVLQFDKELRELWASLPPELNPESWTIPPAFDLDRASEELTEPHILKEMQVQIQAHTIVANVNQTLLHLHRPWFIRAMQSESDPFHSPYARSIVAVSESSRILISIASSMYAKVRRLSLAWNFWWQHVFNAGVCQCLHVLYNPHGMTSFSAWEDVGKAVNLLEEARPGKDDVIWASKLDLLARMKARAASRLKGGSPRLGAGNGANEMSEQLHLVGATSSIDRRREARRSGASRRIAENRASMSLPSGNRSERPTDSSTSDQVSPDSWQQADIDERLLAQDHRVDTGIQSPQRFPSSALHLSSFLEDHPIGNSSATDWGVNSSETLLADMLQDGCEPDIRFWETFFAQSQQAQTQPPQ